MKPGHYKVYPASMQLLQKHKFLSLNNFLIFINTCEYKQFHNEFNISDMRYTFTSLLNVQTVFGKNTRFPEDFYVHMQGANMKSLIEQFWNTVNVLNEFIQSKDNTKCIHTSDYIHSLCCAKQSYNVAFTKLAAVINSTDITHLKEYDIYCRETFEKEYGLTWVLPGPK